MALFSSGKKYNQYRPDYPEELFNIIKNKVQETNSAWDCATGTGQALKGLAPIFTKIQATDISESQIENADHYENVEFSECNSEETSFKDNQFDLVTVAQALHWFATPKFFAEVQRVLKPDGIFAAWTYNIVEVSGDVDDVVLDFHNKILGDYWEPQRWSVIKDYNDINFPFDVESQKLSIQKNWNLDQFIGYLETWSGLKTYKKSNSDPIPELKKALSESWGNDERQVSFPITLKSAQPA